MLNINLLSFRSCLKYKFLGKTIRGPQEADQLFKLKLQNLKLWMGKDKLPTNGGQITEMPM
jgi:hypothetical protein